MARAEYFYVRTTHIYMVCNGKGPRHRTFMVIARSAATRIVRYIVVFPHFLHQMLSAQIPCMHNYSSTNTPFRLWALLGERVVRTREKAVPVSTVIHMHAIDVIWIFESFRNLYEYTQRTFMVDYNAHSAVFGGHSVAGGNWISFSFFGHRPRDGLK